MRFGERSRGSEVVEKGWEVGKGRAGIEKVENKEGRVVGEEGGATGGRKWSRMTASCRRCREAQ